MTLSSRAFSKSSSPSSSACSANDSGETTPLAFEGPGTVGSGPGDSATGLFLDENPQVWSSVACLTFLSDEAEDDIVTQAQIKKSPDCRFPKNTNCFYLFCVFVFQGSLSVFTRRHWTVRVAMRLGPDKGGVRESLLGDQTLIDLLSRIVCYMYFSSHIIK